MLKRNAKNKKENLKKGMYIYTIEFNMFWYIAYGIPYKLCIIILCGQDAYLYMRVSLALVFLDFILKFYQDLF